MAAYGAVVSLVEILKQQQLLLHSDHKYYLSEVETLRDEVLSLQSFFEKLFFVPKEYREDVKNLAIQIRDAIYRALDTIESFIFSQQSHSSESGPGENSNIISLLLEIKRTIDPIASKAEKLAGPIKQYLEKRDFFSKDGLSANLQTRASANRSSGTKIVGQDEYRRKLNEELTKGDDRLEVVAVSGLPGIGKTTLAASIYDDEKIKNHFNILAWVTVSQDYNINEIFAKLLNSMESSSQKAGTQVSNTDDRNLSTQLTQSLYQKKYLIVIDDMWDEAVWDKVKSYLPDHKSGSRIILTTRLVDIAKKAKTKYHLPMDPLNLEDSWTLLCYKIFGENPCPQNLEGIGRKISENCGGLPLSLTVVGGMLSQGSMKEEYWESIGEDVHDAAKKGKDSGELSYKEILALSYDHLPGKIKGCFLYMGLFPEDSAILVSKLIKLWVAEGIFNPPPQPQNIEQEALNLLRNLIDRNLVSVRNWCSDNQIKTCGMHDTLRDLAVQESGNEKFFHSIRKYAKTLQEGAEIQRRVCVHKNVLMCLEDVYESTKTMTQARSIVYAGSHHHHPMPSCLTFDLLRVLDAFTVYFIQFPKEILELIHLRYLALTYNGKLPSLISKLEKLQVLIVRRQPKIIFVGSSFLPNEIWSMSQLRHLLLTETDLPVFIPSEHDNSTVLLANLQTLSNVNAVSCTKEVIQNMPNLKRLGMWMESPGELDFHLDILEQLEAFKLTVLNPIPKPKKDAEVMNPVPYKIEFKPRLFFPETLRKLSLSGCGLPWEDMEIIRKLPNLEVLKLRELAFQGEEWSLGEDDEFGELKYLLFEYLDLKHWNANNSHFPSLQRLFIMHCYELEKMVTDIGEIGDLQLIELIDCSPEAVSWAEEVKEEQADNNKLLKVRIYTSWK